jgi:uncharacterized protein (TIGR02271 family)
MTRNQRTTVVGVFENAHDAQQAIKELRQMGFREDQIGLAAHQQAQSTSANTTDEGNAGTGAMTGALAGAGLGAAWSLAAIAGLIPAIGPVIAGGTLAAVLAGAGLGAAAVGLAGALIGMGIPEQEAQFYEEEFKSGRTVVTVKCDSRYDEAVAILRRHNAYDVDTRAARRTATSSAGAAASSGANETIQVHEEQLQVHKHPVQTGEVRLRKEVRTEHQTIDVPVKKEEVVIERHAVGGAACSSDIHPGEEIRIPVSEEQVSVEKQTVVKEEIKAGKRQVQDTERVSGDVRKEEVRIEKEGNVDVTAPGSTGKKRK